MDQHLINVQTSAKNLACLTWCGLLIARGDCRERSGNTPHLFPPWSLAETVRGNLCSPCQPDPVPAIPVLPAV